MNCLKAIVIGTGIFFVVNVAQAQSPHGKDLKIRCDACHTSESWTVSQDSIAFAHFSTQFLLEGQHDVIDCKLCHTTLEFSKAETDCTSCHMDIHQQTVGKECARCHDSKSWLVNNIAEIHRQNSFPLLGEHAVTNCSSCHKSETDLRFEPLSTDCFSCHQEEYTGTENPDHQKAGYSTDCIECHRYEAFEWSATGINHDFFPLTEGHAINECARCHTGSDYSQISNDCITCHEADYLATTNPNHQAGNFSTSCAECHTTKPGWKPADYREHDLQYFPIFSGSHHGEWDKCSDCHSEPNNFAIFSCTSCHENPETDNDHHNVFGYSYNSTACLACHPNGEADGAFDHNNTNFPLTGAHVAIECLSCHSNGFTGTPTQCAACHTTDFNQSTNPNHTELGLSTDCVSCHTTAPDWNPATFANHNEYYALNGAHSIIANQCATCHQGEYNNTPSTCVGCHLEDYNQTSDPSHTELQFSTDCISCHSEITWIPATFDHDDQYFPIYSGSHDGAWNKCDDCHNTPGNFGEFTCVTCHTNQETTDQHNGVSGYVYNSSACLACHPNGEGEGGFDHSATDFPLTGAHSIAECLSCHANGYTGTPTACQACHTTDFNQTINPNHSALGISTDCATCHTTEPGWNPASFATHNDYYALNGAHAPLISQCVLCHNGDYNNTPNTCSGCHQQDYEQTTDPPHATLQFSVDCASCHNESAWAPSTFNHDGEHFPIYSGSHEGEWAQCSDCHTTPGNYSLYTCITCHTNPQADEDHTGVNGYIYNSTACLACHPTGEGDMGFDHNSSGFPLTGAHTLINCLDCHAAGFEGTPTACQACHSVDYNQSINPNHTALGISTDCAACHTTEPGWSPAAFIVHNDYYPLNGAHAILSSECVICHNGDYTNTPNTCAGCHLDDYDQTTDPSHIVLQFSQDCATCHSEIAWEPSTFDHDGQYFPIYSGSHEGEWAQCSDCHTAPGDYTIFSCTTCHGNPDTDEEHTGINGYVYNSSACLACHPTGEGDFGFDHNTTNFPLTGAHISVNCQECHANGYVGTPMECVACHNGNYDQSLNPNHQALGLSTECVTCHTTTPDWNPASFDIHNDFYVLSGAHALIANQCATCHNGDYNNTPNTCIGCHQTEYNETTNPSHTTIQLPTECGTCHTESTWSPAIFPIHNDFYALNGAHAVIASECVLCHNGDYNNTPNTCVGCHQENYNQTTNPPHDALNFSTDCATCHTETVWSPAEYVEHDDSYFPIYSGGHEGAWDQCSDCHINANNYSVFTCITCHTSSETNQQHSGVSGYIYENSACFACHPAGDAQGAFNHDDSNFPLTGAHTSVNCIECHAGGYQGTPTECNACHQPDFNQASNPNHVSLGLSTDCVTCHTTAPDWNPASFPDHNDYYPLLGAHAAIADQCVTCHNGNYNNTPNTCIGCHQADYNQTNDPDHAAAQFPTTCETCHTQNAWIPANWDHDDLYFPIYSGSHENEWDQCNDCHTNANDYSIFTCITCHEQGETNDDHDEINGYQYNSDACLQCHPDGEGD